MLGGLKSRPKPLKFTEQKLTEEALLAQWSAPVIDRMRTLDNMRKPMPLPDECSLLNIPDRRLDVHVLKDILMLCGCSAGGRFTTTEFAAARTGSQSLSELWESTNTSFELLDKTQRKVVLSRSFSIPAEHEQETVAQLRTELKQAVAAKAAAAAAAAEVQESTNPSGADASESIQHASVIAFHQLADAYLRAVRAVQALARAKQQQLAEMDRDSKADEQAPDDESRGRPMPDWLQTLTDLWESKGLPVVAWHLEHSTVPPVPASAIKLKANTIGKFAAYLSGMMTKETLIPDSATSGTGSANVRGGEGDVEFALWQLLQGSNDKRFVVSADMSLPQVLASACVHMHMTPLCSSVAGAATDSNLTANADANGNGNGDGSSGGENALLDRPYWAQRFWNFLSRMAEVKSKPKDEKGVLLFHLHVVPPTPLPAPTAAEIADKEQRRATVEGGPWQGAACAVKD